MYCIVLKKNLQKNSSKKLYCIVFEKKKLTKKFVKNIGLYCIVFEKEISQKNCIVLYCFLKKNSQKIALYCIVFEKQI